MKNFFLFLTLYIILVSCKKDPQQGQATLLFEHFVKNDALVFNAENYESPTGHPYQVTKLDYYISEIVFIKTDGTEQAIHKGFLIKADDTDEINNTLEPGTYNKVKFQFGFTKTDNHLSYLERTTENVNMGWFDEETYHYMKFEGKYDSLDLGIQKQFKYHFGPTEGNDNSFSVELDITEFEVDDNLHLIKIKADIQEWFQNPTKYNFPDYSMVMKNQNYQLIYKANGQSVFSFSEISLVPDEH